MKSSSNADWAMLYFAFRAMRAQEIAGDSVLIFYKSVRPHTSTASSSELLTCSCGSTANVGAVKFCDSNVYHAACCKHEEIAGSLHYTHDRSPAL